MQTLQLVDEVLEENSLIQPTPQHRVGNNLKDYNKMVPNALRKVKTNKGIH